MSTFSGSSALALAFMAVALPCASARAAEGGATTSIYQQRAADGRIVLTDRPAPGVVIDRVWQMSTEDPALARQRAIDIKLEAEAVSQRVQRTIDLREARLAAEREQSRAARLDAERVAENRFDDGGYGGGVLLYPGYGGRGSRHPNRRPGYNEPAPRPPNRGGFPIKGSAAPGSR